MPNASLHFRALGEHNPRAAATVAYHGLKPFAEYLEAAIKYARRQTPRLGWVGLNEATPKPNQRWVELADTSDGQFEADDHTTRHFFEAEKVQESGTGASREWIWVLDHDDENNRLLLNREPRTSEIRTLPDVRGLEMQRRAVEQLRFRPHLAHAPLLRLFQKYDHVDRHNAWPTVAPAAVGTWQVLKDVTRAGSDEQQRFVQAALGTPDLAILEGPPGSGKTTVICELILQLAAQGKRVLLCASTHVAVDNVLERLLASDAPEAHRALVSALRIDNPLARRAGRGCVP